MAIIQRAATTSLGLLVSRCNNEAVALDVRDFVAYMADTEPTAAYSQARQ